MKSKNPKTYPRGQELLALADAAPRKLRLKDFLPAVDMLRLKGYSWRDCAAWLEKNAGIKCDHTSLMRFSRDREIAEPDDE